MHLLVLDFCLWCSEKILPPSLLVALRDPEGHIES